MDVNDLSEGMVIKIKDALYKITHKESAGHGKAARSTHLKLKDLQSGHTIEHNYKSAEDIDVVDAHTLIFEYLYEEDDFFVFMNTENYEQSRIKKSVIGEQSVFLTPNMQIHALVVDGEPKTIELPDTVEVKVTTAPDGVKGSDKEVTLENGLTILVPHFVAEGESVVIKTDDFSYVKRVTTKSMDNSNTVAGTGDHEKSGE